MRVRVNVRIVSIVLLIVLFSCTDNLSTFEDRITVNSECDPFLQKAGLRILDIGNSYTDDATFFLPAIVDAAKVDLNGLSFYKATRGGATFKNWCDIYNNGDKTNSYSIQLVLGEKDSSVPIGQGKAGDGMLFRRLLSSVKWDLIIIHQSSEYAPYYDLWRSSDEGGYLNELLSIIRRNQPNAKLGFLLIHSYSSSFPRNNEKSSYLRWKSISDSVRSLCEDYDIDYVIPYGTAVQNMRASSWNDSSDLTRDGSHCGIGLCRYTAACCYYESIIAPRTGISIIGNAARYKGDPEDPYSKDVTDINAPIAQYAAYLATVNRYECINPEL